MNIKKHTLPTSKKKMQVGFLMPLRLPRKHKNEYSFSVGAVFFLIIFLMMSFLPTAKAEEIDINALANAIYKAEGGAKTSHPYGILAHYKHTTPRQACINTIKHALKDWDGKNDFISFLGGRYCPVGASNDPKGLNKNWIKNVRYFYNKEDKNG